MALEPGLYIVAGPIGNMEDITLRALAVVRDVDTVYAEDTRVTGKLLARYEIKKPFVSLREQQPVAVRERVAAQLIERVRQGEAVAYLTDAGTPGVSDPGNWLVAKAFEAGIMVTPIPGASALTALLSVSGLPVQRPLFVGFLPKKKGHQTLLGKLGRALMEDEVCDSVVLYESPQRVANLLQDVEKWGDVTVRLGRELTKMHEEILSGTPEEVRTILTNRPTIKGEIVLLVAKNQS